MQCTIQVRFVQRLLPGERSSRVPGENSIHKSIWKYEFSRIPFGLKNAPAVFQRLMDGVLNECFECAAPYVDDILIFSRNWQEHMGYIRKVLGILWRHGLTAKPGKCVWGRSYVQYLGHIVGSGTVAVPRIVTAMAEYKQPVTRKNMRAFLGSIGYYRKFIPQFAKSPPSSPLLHARMHMDSTNAGVLQPLKVSAV